MTTNSIYFSVKQAQAAKTGLHSQGKITYRILTDESHLELFITIIANEGGGWFSNEIGHFISHQAIGVPKSYDFDNELFAPWLDAVLKSDSIHYLNENKDYLTSLGINVDYYLLHHEIWARCYAQYVAVKSGNEKLQSQLDGMRSGLKWNSKRQWQDDDFKPIMGKIDVLFATLGWLND